MERIERIYIATFPFDRVYNSRKKKALEKKRGQEPHAETFNQKIESIFRIQLIIGIITNTLEEKDFYRDALTAFRLKTWGLIGGLIIGTLFGIYTYLFSHFQISSVALTTIWGGLLCAFAAARYTLLTIKKNEHDYLI